MYAKHNDDVGSAGSWRPARDNGARRPDEVELRVHEALTCRTAPAFCREVEERMRVAPRRLWINLEEVKASDVVGLAAPARAAEAALARDCGNAAILDAEGCQAESLARSS